jgi:hypothetical protein
MGVGDLHIDPIPTLTFPLKGRECSAEAGELSLKL